ncbi:MAG TPA: hypothetical protein VMJ10_28380 [Kofleriaceae bacterium]|nr:hypothetical protein [Kofleriaceae bacterium]
MRLRSLAPCLAAAACATSPGTDPATTAGACPAPAGKLVLYAIPPGSSLDWSTPNNLLDSVLASSDAGTALVQSGQAVMTHEIGHVNVELDCGDFSIPLTGQTGGGTDWQSAGDGVGILLRDTPGAMNDTAAGDVADTTADIAARQQSGKLSRISFVVNQAMCTRLKSFYDAYLQSGAFTHYAGLYRPRRFEGAGCAIFGAGMVDVGGLLRRSLFTPVWARTEMIGSARIANFAGSPSYQFGSDLVARDASGHDWVWPEGQSVPAPAGDPVWLGSPVLDAWSGPEDQPFPIAGLPGAMQSQLPFSIYDPELMAEWAEQVFAQARAQGSADSLGATWTADTVEAVHEVTYDAHCVAPQTLAFEADNDDLFADSDAP